MWAQEWCNYCWKQCFQFRLSHLCTKWAPCNKSVKSVVWNFQANYAPGVLNWFPHAHTITPQVERKNIVVNEWMNECNVKIRYKYLHMPTYWAFLFLQSFTRQLEATIIEVAAVQMLRLRANSGWVHEAKYLPPTKVTYGHARFNNGQATCFNTKPSSTCSQNLGICTFFKLILTWVMIKSTIPSLTTLSVPVTCSF